MVSYRRYIRVALFICAAAVLVLQGCGGDGNNGVEQDLSNHVVNATCCSSHSQRRLSLPHLPSTGSVTNTKRYVTADNGFSGPLPVAA